MDCYSGGQVLSMKRLAFNVLTTPKKETGLSCLQSASIEGDVETVKSILHCSPNKLDSAIALSVKIGPKASHFGGKSILSALSQQDSPKYKQIREIIETIQSHFQSQSLLHLTAKKGRPEHLRRLLDCGECVNSASPDSNCNETPLMLAARYNEEDVVEFLVENGASLKIQDKDGFTAFHHAVQGGKIRNVLRLIEVGANVQNVSHREKSAMHLAAEHGHVEVIKLLLEHGADVNQFDGEPVTPVMLAARSGHLDAIRFLIENGGDLNERGSYESILPIHLAAYGEHLSVVKFLLEKGSSLLERSLECDETILHMASSLELVSFLVERGADIHARDAFGETPLHTAAFKGQADTVNYLLDHGADINARAYCGGTKGYSPLLSALKHGHAASAKILIERGTKFQYTKEEDVSKFLNAEMLSLAAEHGFVEVLQLLLDNGLPADGITKNGETALSAAARAGKCETVTVLLDRGANINGVSGTGPRGVRSTICDGHEDIKNDASADDDDNDDDDDDEGGGVGVDDDDEDDDDDDDDDDAHDDDDDIFYSLHRRSDDEDDYYHDWLCPTRKRAKGITPLYCALENGKGKVAKLLIERGADISNPDGVSNSLIELAAKNRLFDIVDLLADKNRFGDNQDFDKFQESGASLILAASRKDLDALMILLKKGVDVNAKNMAGDTALASVLQSETRPEKWHIMLNTCTALEIIEPQPSTFDPFVVQSRTSPHTVMEIVKALLAFGADINTKNDKCETPLLMAARTNAERVAELFLELGVDTNIRDVHSYSPLHYAAQNNNGKLAEMLLQYGADTSVKTDQEEMSPLHCAARSKSLHVVQVLLEHCVDLEVTDSSGRTPLAVAAASGCFPIIRLLIQQGSNVHAKDKDGQTPFTIAVENLIWEDNEAAILIETFLEHGSSVNDIDQRGRSAFHYLHLPRADTQRWPSPDLTRELCDLFLHFGASVNLQDENGETPLHFAASSGNTTATEWLLQHGADLRALDMEHRSPLHAAAHGRYSSSVELLIQNGADINLRDKEGWLPLHLLVVTMWGRTPFSNQDAEILFPDGSDATVIDRKGRSLLHLAAKREMIQLIEFFIRRGCNVNARDFSGETVLGELAKIPRYGTEHILQLYLDNGGDKHAVDLHKRTVLHFAAKHGCEPAMIDSLLEQGLDIEARDKNGETPLHRAVALGNPKMTELFIARGADLSSVNHRGETPLLVSLNDFADSNDSDLVTNVLLEHKSDVRVSDKNGNTALHGAIFRPLRLLKLIIQDGGDVNAVNVHGCTPLHQAAYKGSPLKHAKVLFRAGANIHFQDKQGNTPLHIAIARKSDDIAEALIKEGSDVNATNVQGRTCLHMASRFGSSRILEQVILHGGQINAVDELGSTALHLAGLLKRHGWQAKVLLKHGSDPGAVDYKGSTPFHVACFSGNKEAASVLIDFGSNLEAKDSKGCTPLHICSVFDQKPTARLLLERGAHLEARDNEGSTPLHLASAFSDVHMVGMLLEHGANVLARDSEGGTALHTAAALGKMKTVQVLVDAGGDVNGLDANGYTPLHVSAASGHMEIVRLLVNNGAEMNAVDKEGRTPARCAKSFGYKKVKQFLEERNDSLFH